MSLDLKEFNRSLNSLSKKIKTILLPHTYSRQEIILSIALLRWITKAQRKKELLDTIESLPFGPSLKKHTKKIIKAFDPTLLDDLPKINRELVISDSYGSWLQNSLKSPIRKQYAANYTQDANKIIKQISLDRDHISRIIDPFAGSGRLLTAYLGSLTVEQLDHIELVHANELMPTAAILSYVRLKTEYPEISLQVSAKNGFSLSGRYDLVIMNPPFTRSQHITEEIRESLSRLAQSYDDDFQQSGLHIWAIYLSDTLLGNNGMVLTVLPAAAIMSRYSQNMKDFLLSQYTDLTLWTFQRSKAYSQGSSLKELFLQGTKGQASDVVHFTTLEPDLEDLRTTSVEIEKLQGIWNWTALYSRPELVKLVNNLQSGLNLVTAAEIELEIIRGIELYGPNFFFFPNKRWQISYPTISDDSHRFHFKHAQLLPVLRKPSLYQHWITPQISQYCLVVDQIDSDLLEYMNVNEQASKVARQRFGDDWIHHTRDQIKKKNPTGHLFILDKMDLTRSALLCHYTDRSYLCTKNFYLVRLDGKQSKLLAAWMNSSLYLALYLVYRREIGGTYGRMQIMDYYHQQLFLPSLKVIDTPSVHDAFDKLRSQKLGFLDQQIETEVKRDLDEAILDALHLEIDLDFLYAFIAAEFEELKIRS